MHSTTIQRARHEAESSKGSDWTLPLDGDEERDDRGDKARVVMLKVVMKVMEMVMVETCRCQRGW